jgi:hypothetical protein
MDAIINPFEVENASDFNTPYEYKLKTINFANKTVDFVMTKIKHKIPTTREAFKGMITGYPKTLTEDEQEEKRLENVRRSATRAKQAVHHAVRSLGADHMLTLHTRENIQDRAQFFTIFQRFVRLVREKDVSLVAGVPMLVARKEKRVWGYVACSELQQRGAYHMHVACVGKQDLVLLRACWYVALGGNPSDKGSAVLGQVDVRYREKRFSGQTDVHKTFTLVSYMTKYISKSFEDAAELGLRRYNASRSIPKPIVNKQFIWSSYANNGGGFAEAVTDVFAIANFLGVDVSTCWNRGEDIFVLRGVEQ